MRLLARCLGILLLAASALAQATKPPPARADLDATESVQALLQLARRQSDQGKRAAALASLTRARAVAPNSEEVLRAYAEASLAAREPLCAIRVLADLTRLCPTVAHYHYLQGVALARQGDTAAAVESLKEAERLEPNQPLALIALAAALNDGGFYAEAKPHLLRALSLEPDSVEAAATLAEAEEGLGELEAAQTHARRALTRQSTHAIANLVMGGLLMKQDRYADARDVLLKAAAADPAPAKAHQQLSLAYAHLNDPLGSQKHSALYQRMLKETEERVNEVRRLTGFSPGGMQP